LSQTSNINSYHTLLNLSRLIKVGQKLPPVKEVC